MLIALWSTCISYATSIFAATNLDRLDILKVFVQKKILYDEGMPVDSAICWSKNVLPDIRKDKQDRATYFLLQLQLANAYTLRGDISLAIDHTRLMYGEAKEMECDFGTVVASQAIGDAHAIANQRDKALESYRGALKGLHFISPHHSCHIQLPLKQSNTLQRKGQLKDAKEVLDEVKNTLGKKPDYATTFFTTIEEASYAISYGHLSHSYLREAAEHLKSVDSIYRLYPEKFCYFHLKYTAAAYYWAMGSQDVSNWDKAAQLCEELRQECSVNRRSTYYRWITLETIYLHKTQGKSMEACRLYQELYPTVDTLTIEGYTRQINTLRAKYRVDQMEITNKEEHNRLITSMLAGSIILLLMFTVIAFRLKKQQQKITLSTQNLECLRTNAEDATSIKSIFLSNMSHEIRTPLDALSGFSSLLTEEGLDNETRRQYNDVILQNFEPLLKLINDMIDLSNLKFGKVQFSTAKRDVIDVYRNVTNTVNKVKQAQAKIHFITERKSTEIETNDSRLQQVLINLSINATKLTPQGGIILEIKRGSKEGLLFSVTDTGCGVLKEEQVTTFQRFKKLNENAQESRLGLSICQFIIEHIGGKIWIDPNYTNGSRFCFTHPIRQLRTAKGRGGGKI